MPPFVSRLVILVVGVCVATMGIGWLGSGHLAGLLVVGFGVDLIARPTARRLPRPGALVELLLSRWRVP